VETARYVVGCLLVVGLPPGLAWWFAIHPLVDFWRRLGIRTTYVVMTLGSLVGVGALYRVRDALLLRDLGTNWILVVLALAFVSIAAVIGVRRRKHLTFGRLAGAPELAAGGGGGTLLTEGLYGVIRNPRYVEVLAGSFGYACFANHVGGYVVAFLAIPLLHLVVLLEERELRARFGAAYAAYCEQVPRYVPRRRSA
jgi:protein-S-isoprenylcysteine O-methyltransferase Ste14